MPEFEPAAGCFTLLDDGMLTGVGIALALGVETIGFGFLSGDEFLRSPNAELLLPTAPVPTDYLPEFADGEG